MTNTINTLKNAPGVIASLAAGMLEDECQFAKSIDKADETDFGGKNGFNSGDTIYINKPARFVPGTSADITSTIQDVVEEKVALTLNIRKVVPIALTSAEIATDMALKSWTNRVLKPAVSSIAQHIESAFLDAAVDATYNTVGDADNTTVYNTDMVLSAGQKIDENGCSMFDDRYLLLHPAANRSAVNARSGLFQSSEEIAKQYKLGYMGTADGFTFLRNNLLPTVTNGNDVSGVAVDDTVATGASTIHLDGITTGTGTVKKGSVFTIDGVYAVHPITKETLSHLQQFVVTADVTASGTSDADVAISPTIYSSASGSLQNVSALPANDATVTFVGAADYAGRQSLAYHKSAFRMASVPLVTPDGTDMAAQKTHKGFTIRVIRDYDVLTDKLIMRLDFLGGIAAVRPEWACRIAN